MIDRFCACWLCGSLLTDAGECLGYVWYDIMECLLVTSLGFVVVNIDLM